MQRRASLVQGLLAAFALSPFLMTGCAQPASGGGTGGSNGSGGSSSGHGGSSATGGSTGAGGSHTGGTTGSSGGNTGAGGVTNTGGSTGAGGSHTGGSTGSGGSNTGSGGSNSGNGGSNTGSGGSNLGGSSGNRACGAPASGDVVADFEEGTNQNVMQGGRQGWWSAFGDSTGTQTPASSSTGPGTAAMVTGGAPSGDTCDMFAMHSTGTGHDTTSGYVGFGTSFDAVLPPPASTTAKTRNPYDLSGYDGISFKIKSTSGTAPPVWVEFQDTENVPTPDGTAQYKTIDQYNTRGMLLTGIGSTWTTVYVPFGIIAPRYLPSTTSTDCSNGNAFCQAPVWDPKNALGFQFGVYPQFTVQPFTSSSSLNYDLWVDDVTLYKGDDGLGTWTSSSGSKHPFPVDSAKVGSCSKPAGASGKYLVQMYNTWKKTFVTGSGNSTRVIRPENGNDTVSEGIGYGMLIAVYMGDQPLFDGLWSYAKAHPASGLLMNWCIPGNGGSCSASGGSATDADEDMAFALLQADKQWGGGSYASDASMLIKQIGDKDIDTGTMLPNGGSNFGSGMQTNPSYWAPAYYRAFATVDSGHPWNTIANNVYTALNAIAGKSNGNAAGALVPAWCSGSNCGSVAGNGYTDGAIYQYDAHRVPWRFGLDACWNGTTSGSTFLSKNAAFFANIAKNGIGRIVDIYSLSGTASGDAAPNSMSIVGTAGVGAMAAGNSFASTAWQFLLDASYSPQSLIKDTQGHIGYTYFNATVGLLTALTLSGNFNSF
jgi:endo-1,4-beta-D-glucanase Y